MERCHHLDLSSRIPPSDQRQTNTRTKDTYVVIIEKRVDFESVESNGSLKWQKASSFADELVTVHTNTGLSFRFLLGRILSTLQVFQPVHQLKEAVALAQHETKLRRNQHTCLHVGDLLAGQMAVAQLVADMSRAEKYTPITGWWGSTLALRCELEREDTAHMGSG